MARKFRLFWNAVRTGDRGIQEKLVNDWLPVFFMLKKNNYVEIALAMIEREYEDITYDKLSLIRINSGICFFEGSDSRGSEYSIRCLDEVMENINKYMKQMLLGANELSWKVHYPNIMFAKKSMVYETIEFVKSRLQILNCYEVQKNEVSNLYQKMSNLVR